ncbi:MAG TPA: pyridoxal phosphate-dependent aminotransferase, partial [Thermoanaerobaculia bacterium]|nr:pyridoxal phosphate-dependent aminotransferase [Thermoanaerobaculia bacterium]
MNFSKRTEWHTPINALTRARQSKTARGLSTLDLTETNPTAVGLDYPIEEIRSILAEGASAPYEPQAAGLASAREALARSLSEDGHPVSPDDLILTSSTSEAYSYLFKLLMDPGDHVLIATPGYPLFDHLAALELIELNRFPLELDVRWSLHADVAAAQMTDRTRAIAVVHPNNPTGSFLLSEEQDGIADLCAERGAALISDEVFLDYDFGPDP